METVVIILKPTFSSTLKSMGFTEYEDYDSDSVLFQQGFNIVELEVNPGETFTIGKNFEEGYLEFEENEYKLIENTDWEDDETQSDDCQIVFRSGCKYLFHADGITFERI